MKTERSLQIRDLSVENKIDYFNSFIGKTQDVLVEKVAHGVASGYGEHYIPVRFKLAGAQKNAIHKVRLLERKGDDENSYLFGEAVL